MLSLAMRQDLHEVRVAENGAVAAKLQREDPADVVIMDILMPEKEGIETILEFRREYPETAIIAISGGGRLGAVHYLQMAKIMGVAFVFEKPLHPAQLREAIRRVAPTHRIPC